MSDVYVDHVFLGNHSNALEFVKGVKKLRSDGKIPEFINVFYDESEDKIEILTEKGRIRRPLIIVENGKSRITDVHLSKLQKGELVWSDLVKEGVVEFLDADEEENAFISLNEKELTSEHTHLELTPFAVVGLLTGMVPYAEHNQGPRVSFGSKLQKQGVGVYAQNFHLRQDTDTHLLHYPQRPIVETIVLNHINYDDHPIGQNVVIAVMSFDGYNMHDSIIINKASIERGLFRSTYFKPYKSSELKYLGGQVDLFEIPDKEVRGFKKEEDYRFLEDDGIIFPESVVTKDDVLIGKTSPPRFLAEMEEFKMGVEARRDASITVDDSGKSVVDTVVITENEEGNKSIKVKLRIPKIPEMGDKFTTRHGQKGVIGIMLAPEDMPQTADGVIPDIIFNPHSLPGRMTVSQLLEMIAGKAGALQGEFIDGTVFDNVGEKEFSKILKNHGFREDGAESLIDGVTGEPLKARILVGNIYYLRLKHLVSSKIHARSRGPMQLLTRQPTEGRAKDGGLRLGEMEKDVLIAHGASLLLKERFDSDKTIIPVCDNCGLTSIYNKFRNESVCPSCKDSRIKFVEMSYAFKLLLDELRSLGIHPKIDVGPKKG
ncbi:MAG: DNA-directed RNA polymerase subunit B [Nanoarchaeota archaeon]|nr:DNA-directed RNA polymerase subunit B [Nanoarchaeota archaeon]